MKTNALVRIEKASLIKYTGVNLKRKKVPTTRQLDENENLLEKLWEMYQNQQKRTQEVLIICDALRQELHELKQKQLQEGTGTTAITRAEEKERKLQPIAYDKLNKLSKYVRQIFAIGRLDYANALVHIIHTLYQLKGRATPDQVFTAADVTDISGFRYVRKLKDIRMLKYHPTSKKGLYIITEVGKKFVEGKITTREQYVEEAKIEGIWEINPR